LAATRPHDAASAIRLMASPERRAYRVRVERVESVMSERRYWIGVVSADHAEAAVANGFVQLAFGQARPLSRMQPGDGFAIYSPRTAQAAGKPLQAFTAIGRIGEGPVYAAPPVDPSPAFRRDVAYLDARPAPIRPLLARLSFIRNKDHWGAAFRFGVVRVPREDFAAIATAMGRDAVADFA
jgi:hypothetical protein